MALRRLFLTAILLPVVFGALSVRWTRLKAMLDAGVLRTTKRADWTGPSPACA
ncbi:hypothetical protein [Shinella sp. NM-101]|uniref:hypothetical protein n=1 Tax=Shinella sp. NM-101 TaxID=2744455 RepID=UPI001F1D0E24|nr:hypothetical protein [Shinella sp. NM-101]